MKCISRAFCALAVVMALSAMTYARAGATATASGTVTLGAGSMKARNERGYGLPDVTGSAVGGAGSSPPTGRYNRGRADGLNMGTRSGANSDVNRPRNAPKGNGQ
jgi:hypothetical protein